MALRQTPDKGLVFRCSQALLEDCQDLGHVALEQSGYGQLQAGKCPAVDHAGRIWRQRRIAAFRPLEPIKPPVVYLPDKVFPHAVSAVGLQLVVQVVGGAAGGSFNNELGRAFDVIVRGN